MSLAALSPESKISNGLRLMNCADHIGIEVLVDSPEPLSALQSLPVDKLPTLVKAEALTVRVRLFAQTRIKLSANGASEAEPPLPR
jgi:hypothetical protein